MHNAVDSAHAKVDDAESDAAMRRYEELEKLHATAEAGLELERRRRNAEMRAAIANAIYIAKVDDVVSLHALEELEAHEGARAEHYAAEDVAHAQRSETIKGKAFDHWATANSAKIRKKASDDLQC